MNFSPLFPTKRSLAKPARLVLSFFLLLYIGFCGCDPAQSKNVPDSFNLESFDRVIDYSLNNYLDPDMVHAQRSYIGAAEDALRALPYSLMLMPASFYDRMGEMIPPERQVPGKALRMQAGDPFVIVVPDYVAIEKRRKEVEAREKLRRKGMTAAQRNAEAEKMRDQIKTEEKALEDAWAKINFTRDDFLRVVKWAEAHLAEYNKLPPTFDGENPYAENPFGMHYVYFAAANGFLQKMDPHSAVMDTTHWDKIRKESEDASFEGIGALLRGGGTNDVVVETPLPGSPAVRAGLRAGDVIRRVDGKSIDNLSLSDVVKRIRGPKETQVALEVQRAGEVESITIKIKRGVIEQKAVSSSYLMDLPYNDFMKMRVGVIRIASFLFDTRPPSDLVRAEYYQLMNKADGHLDGLILDLRGNPGGALDEAINVAGLFLPKNSVVVEIRSKEENKKARSHEPPLVLNDRNVPIVVLVNANSASASEIVASALQDYNAGLIIGERTFGKASVQSLRSMGNITLKLTTARYYAPKGYTIQVYGVEPDLAVSDEIEGGFPVRYREEDMWKHLPELKHREMDPARTAWVERLKASAAPDTAAAEAYLKKHEKDQVRPDAMLIRALPLLKAMKTSPSP